MTVFKRNFFTKCQTIQILKTCENIVINVFDNTSCETKSAIPWSASSAGKYGKQERKILSIILMLALLF